MLDHFGGNYNGESSSSVAYMLHFFNCCQYFIDLCTEFCTSFVRFIPWHLLFCFFFLMTYKWDLFKISFSTCLYIEIKSVFVC